MRQETIWWPAGIKQSYIIALCYLLYSDLSCATRPSLDPRDREGQLSLPQSHDLVRGSKSVVQTVAIERAGLHWITHLFGKYAGASGYSQNGEKCSIVHSHILPTL